MLCYYPVAQTFDNFVALALYPHYRPLPAHGIAQTFLYENLNCAELRNYVALRIPQKCHNGAPCDHSSFLRGTANMLLCMELQDLYTKYLSCWPLCISSVAFVVRFTASYCRVLVLLGYTCVLSFAVWFCTLSACLAICLMFERPFVYLVHLLFLVLCIYAYFARIVSPFLYALSLTFVPLAVRFFLFF